MLRNNILVLQRSNQRMIDQMHGGGSINGFLSAEVYPSVAQCLEDTSFTYQVERPLDSVKGRFDEADRWGIGGV
jgi:hypothetical protein